MADGVGGMAEGGGLPRLTLSSLAVLAFHGGGAGVHGRAGDGRDIPLDPPATAPPTVTTAVGMVMQIPATVPTVTAPNTVTMAGMAMEIPATDLETGKQANTAPQLDRGYPNYNNDSLVPVIIMGQSMESSGPRRKERSAPTRRTMVTQVHPLPPVPSVFGSLIGGIREGRKGRIVGVMVCSRHGRLQR